MRKLLEHWPAVGVALSSVGGGANRREPPSYPGAGEAAGSRPAADARLAARAAELDAAYGARSAAEILRLMLAERILGEIALVSSFGSESAVLLQLAAGIDPALPVVFIDTGRLFPETLDYRDQIIAKLGLSDVRTVGPGSERQQALDPHGALFAIDPDRCCGFRKVEPLARALEPFEAWITGRKRYQGATRAAIPVFEADATHIKVSPLATWSMRDIATYLRAHALPVHPLVTRGYRSIGCMPCTSPVAEGEDPRAGRWRGFDKTECGIHSGLVSDGEGI